MTLTTSLGKRLADTDANVRNKSLRKLESDMGNTEGVLETLEDCQRVWRSLWYGLWMADKRPVQTQVAVQAVSLGTKLSDEKFIIWNRAFFLTLIDMWPKLDRHRIDKYLLLIRVFVAELFRRERISAWNDELIKSLSADIINCCLKCLGVGMHVMRVWWEELDAEINRSETPVTKDIMTLLMEAPLKVATTSKISALVQRTCRYVLIKPDRLPKSLQKGIAKQLNARARETEIEQDLRVILYEASEALSSTTRS